VTEKERMSAALEAGRLDRFPVVVPYVFLLQCDHWCELTGQPAWTYHAWLVQEPAQHVKEYERFDAQLPFDILQPQWAPSREWRESVEVVHEGDKHYFKDRRTGKLHLLNEDLPHLAAGPNETQRVFDRADVDSQVIPTPAEKRLEWGDYDFIREASRTFGDRKFIMNGVVGTFYQCTHYVGETNLFLMLHEKPDLIEYLSARLLERTIEGIRALAAAGDDAIYIDDALTTSDLVSPQFYERFSLPYVRPMVEEIHRLGRKAVLIYFGGIADRLDQIASLGADSLSFETTMKSYVNDLGEIAEKIGKRLCLWGNIDPVRVVQDGTDQELRQAIEEQVAIGRCLGRFIVSTGSPITPRTPIPRVRRFIDLGRQIGVV